MTKRKVSKNKLYLYGFLKDNMTDVLKLQTRQAIQESKIQAYSIVMETLFNMLKKFPNNELLLLTIAQIYIKHLEDVPRAVYALSCLAKHESIYLRNSVQDLCNQLEELFHKRNFKLDKDHNFRNYFVYKGKTSSLKKEIQIEILSHLKLWEALQKNKIDSRELILNAEDIATQATKIEEIWQKELEGLTKDYANISIIYGLYLDVIQGKSHIWKSLINKSHEILVNMKDQSRREINEILDGNSAIIIASIEPEKLGKVVDASASVKQLFDIDKKSLIGANIDTLLPQIIAKRHNELIMKYYKEFKYGYNRYFQSYAKTINNHYFHVQINLRLYQNIQQGVNLMSYVRMMSEHISLIITDETGKILDCSQDLQTIFNLNGRVDDLSKFCKEFHKINQAFNVVYKPKERVETFKNITTDQIDQITLNKWKSTSNNLYKRAFSHRSERLSTAKEGRETHRLLLMSDIIDTPDTDENVKSPRKPSSMSINMQKEDAENICNDFKEGKILKFFVEVKIGFKEFEFETQIEPYIFEGDLYKIWKLKPVSIIPTKGVLLSEKVVRTQNDLFADDFPKEEELSSLSAKKEGFKESHFLSPKFVSNTGANTILPLKLAEDDEKRSERIKTEIKKQELNHNSSKTQTLSVMSTHKSNKERANSLYEIFSQQKMKPVFKISVIIIYLTFLGVICLVVLDSVIKLKSLDDMQKALGLADIVNKRLFRTIYAWQAILVVYSRSAGLRPITATTKLFQAIAKNASFDMVENNNLLKAQVVDFGNSEIAGIFFEKVILLWDPFANKTSLSGKVDSFTANERLHSCNLIVVNYPRSIIDLKDREEVLFTINNTANDYLITVEIATNKVENFYLDSAEKDMTSLFILLSSKLLTLLGPFMLMLILCRVLLKSYSKLMRAISKIDNRKIDERINQLNSLKALFDKEVEENIHLKIHNKTIETIKFQGQVTSFSLQNKTFSLRRLLLYLGKYFLLIFIIAVPLVALFMTTFLQAQRAFTDLNSTTKKMLISYRLGARIMLILPNFYFLTIFKNQTTFKIRNELPEQQLLYHINFLNSANDILISEIRSAKGEPEDPYIEDLLQRNLCDYMTDTYFTNCLDSTSYRSFGLLGVNSKYLVTCVEMMKDFLITPTFAKGSQLLTVLGPLLGSIPPVLQKGYELLAAHFMEKFREKSEDQETKTLIFLLINAIAILLWIILIMTTIITKLEKLELCIRKILRTIPYQIIHGSKAIQYYLSDEFKNELKDIKEF